VALTAGRTISIAFKADSIRKGKRSRVLYARKKRLTGTSLARTGLVEMTRDTRAEVERERVEVSMIIGVKLASGQRRIKGQRFKLTQYAVH
jgi:hypothetical protein